MKFTDIFKITAGVASGIYAFKLLNNMAETITECREIYDTQIQNNFTPKRPNQEPAVTSANTELKKDAVNALVNLGYKVRDSKDRVEIAITRGGCKTIQEVIKYVLQNNSNS
jgi:Holliday junction resolvasome RuvABC DNA-binding subunit